MSGFLFKDGGCDGNLSIAEAAVARADLTMLEDFEPFLLKPGAQETGKTAIVHASTGEGDLSDAGELASTDHGRDEGLCDASMELRCDLCLRHSASKIVHECTPELGSFDDSGALFRRIRLGEYRHIFGSLETI